MLFVYKNEVSPRFWMKEMQIPLDMVWIRADCTIADITRDAPIPEPDQDLNNLPRFSPSEPVQYVLEINAGESEQSGLAIGDTVAFTGTLEGYFGC